MAKAVSGNNQQNQQNQQHGQQQQQSGQGQQQQQQQQTGSIAAAITNAFGLSGDNSRAGQFVKAVREQLDRSGNTPYMVGTVPSIESQYASVAYIAFNYGNVTAFSVAVFEVGSSVIRWNENNRKRYTTVASLVDEDPNALTQIGETIKAQHGLSSDPYFVTLNVVPAGTQLTDQMCNKIAAQMVTGIESRGDRLGSLNITDAPNYLYAFNNYDGASCVDKNGVTLRTDWALTTSAVSTNSNMDNRPTLQGNGSGNLPQPTVAVGYINLRYTGPKESPRKYMDNPLAYDATQISPEIVVEQIDSITGSNMFTLERDIIALAGVANVAREGGWMSPLVNSMKNGKRTAKLSGLANHLILPDIQHDFKSWDADPQKGLEMVCRPTATVVVKSRKGDGISGLPTLLGEIAYGNKNSLEVLLRKLNNLFMVKNDINWHGTVSDGNGNSRPLNFTEILAKGFGITPAELTSQHIVVTCVNKPSGSYDGPDGKRSTDDVDLLEVGTRCGDNVDVFKGYTSVMSYDNRRVDVEQAMIDQMDLIDGYRSQSNVYWTGDALEMVLNPTFVNLLLAVHDRHMRTEYSGVIKYTPNKDELFIGGVDYSVAPTGGPAAQTGFGSFGATSRLNF